MCNIGTATLLKGIEQGRAEGEANGELKKAMETAIKMLQRGKDSIEEIAELTGLPLETVQNLADEMASA